MNNNISCKTLSEIADEARLNNDYLNVYRSSDFYNATHPNATQDKGGADDPQNNKGKEPLGAGKFDGSPAGSYIDINGRPDLLGSGRVLIDLENKYTPEKKYDCF